MIPWPDFTAVPTAVIRADLTPLALRLVLALAKHANASRVAWPKHEALLRLLPPGTSESALIRAKHELVTKGWLDFQRGAGKGSPGHKSCEYTLMMPSESALTIPSGDEGVRSDVTERSGESVRNGQVEKELSTELSTELTTSPPIVPTQKRKLRIVKLEYTEAFENLFWKVLPPKAQACGKKTAFQKWSKALENGATVEEMMAGLQGWLTSKQWGDGYVHHASTWLNKELWKHNPEQAGAATKTGRAHIPAHNHHVVGETAV